MSAAPLAPEIAQLEDYMSRVREADPDLVYAEVAQHYMPGKIVWTVAADGMVTRSVGAGFKGLDGIEPRDAEGTHIDQWTAVSRELLAEARERGAICVVVEETEGPAAGRVFITSATYRAEDGSVTFDTFDPTAIERGLDLLQKLAG